VSTKIIGVLKHTTSALKFLSSGDPSDLPIFASVALSAVLLLLHRLIVSGIHNGFIAIVRFLR
jgi:hypothetical protein